MLLWRNARPDAPARRTSDLLLRGEVEGIGEGDGEASSELCHWDGLCLDPEILGLAAEEILVDREIVRQRKRCHVEIRGGGQGEGRRIDQVLLHKIPFKGHFLVRRLTCNFLELFRL